MTNSQSTKANDDRTTAIGTFNYALSYLASAQHLAGALQKGELRLRFDAPVDLLLGHAFEMLYKSYLRHSGLDLNALKALSHNLTILRRKAIETGLDDCLDTNEQSHLDLLNMQFGVSPYDVRYIRTGAYTAHDSDIALGAAIKLARAVGAYLDLPQWLRDRLEASQGFG